MNRALLFPLAVETSRVLLDGLGAISELPLSIVRLLVPTSGQHSPTEPAKTFAKEVQSAKSASCPS